MPSLPLRPCAQAGCAKLVARGRCEAHRLPERQQKAMARPYDDRRESSTKRGYGYGWQQRRRAFILRHPLCAVCGAKAVEVDHKIAKRLGGPDNDANCQSICRSCHARKTKREQWS